MLKYFATSLAFLLLVNSAPKAQSLDAQSQFEKGVIFYQNGNLEQARLLFDEVAHSKTENPFATSALFMAAKTALAQKDLPYAKEMATKLIKQFPQSRYKAYAYYVRGGANYFSQQYSDAAKDLTFCIELADSDELRRLAESTATHIVDNYVGKTSLDKIYSAYPWKNAQPILTIWRANAIGRQGEPEKARQMLKTFIASNPAPRYRLIAEELSQKNFSAETKAFRIGLLQPLSGYFMEEANDFLKGLAFAIHQQSKWQDRVELVVKDTKGNIVETIKQARALLDANVDLIITGLEGQKAAAAAGVLQDAGIPVIIPVSTDNNLSQLGENIFQMNSDLETRGSKLAQFAMNSLKMKNFATLAPADDYGNALTDAFANKVDQMGGTIISQQWYYPGTSDFSRQLQSLREAGFRYAYRDSIRAWGMDINLARIDSVFARIDRSIRIESEDNEGLADFTDMPVTSIDGFFLPIYEEDIPYVASQFALYNIKARLLGGDSWSNANLLREQQRYVNGAVFFAGYYINETDLNYINFVRDFRITTSSSPGTMAIYGYNIMNLILQGLSEGNSSPAEVSDYLKNVTSFKGIGTEISFTRNRRTNSAVNILQFQDGNIIRAQSVE